MQIAQRLYEGVDIDGETVGVITYMRTDGADMAPEAIAAARNTILKLYGEPYVPAVAAQIHDQRPKTRKKPTKLFARPNFHATLTNCVKPWMRTNLHFMT